MLISVTGLSIETETGTYTVTGNRITITPDDGGETPSQITVSGNTITVVDSSEDDGETFTSTEVFVKS